MKTLKRFTHRISVMIALTFIYTSVLSNVIPTFQTMQTVEASTLKLNIKSTTIKEGDTKQLKVINLKKKAVTWSSSDKNIATVSNSGLVTGVSAGKVNITATVSKTKLSCSVTVEKKIVNEPNVTAKFDRIENINGISKAVQLTITNNGTLPITLNADGYMYDPDGKLYCSNINMFDYSDTVDHALLDTLDVLKGQTVIAYYRKDDLSNFIISILKGMFYFNFTYDDVDYIGCVDVNGNFTYKQGVLENE